MLEEFRGLHDTPPPLVSGSPDRSVSGAPFECPGSTRLNQSSLLDPTSLLSPTEQKEVECAGK